MVPHSLALLALSSRNSWTVTDSSTNILEVLPSSLSQVHKRIFSSCFVFIFTGAMLEQVERRRLGDIICENTDIEELTQNVFIQVLLDTASFLSFLKIFMLFTLVLT